MNKLLVSDIIELSNGDFLLNSLNDELEVIVNGQVTIYLINEKLRKLSLKAQNNSELKVYKFNDLKENNLMVKIEQEYNSKIYYNEAIINEQDNYLKIDNYINGNDNESHINVRNICNDNRSNIIINVNIAKETKNNIALEDLKGINNGGFIHIEPNIICESNEVIANHLTTIGSIDIGLLNYLMGKGISEKLAKEILLKGFIYSNMDNYIKEIGR